MNETDPTTPKFEQIAQELAHSIMNGQYAPGEKLPPHRVLAAKLGVTTSTVSRAYSSLERQGLASARVGDGTYVRNLDTHADGDGPPAAEASTPIDLAHNVAIPTDEVACLNTVLQQLSQEPHCLQDLLGYQSEVGAKRHRVAGAQWLRRFGTSGNYQRVMVTHGAQHALAGVLRTLARPGDTLLTESLTYPGLLGLARSLRLQVIGVDTDEQGLRPDALDRAASTFQTKLLFCTPTLHSPLITTMDMARREAIAQVVRRRGLHLIEDVVHAAILENPPPALATLAPDTSFLIASMSKVMAPGLRVGYLEAAPQWLDKVAASVRADCWMVAPLLPEIAARWIESGQAEELTTRQRDEVDARLACAHAVLHGLTYQASAHHPHVWLPLPSPWQTAEFVAALRQAGVLVRPADLYAAGRTKAPTAIRISLNVASSRAQLEEGLNGVRRVLSTR